MVDWITCCRELEDENVRLHADRERLTVRVESLDRQVVELLGRNSQKSSQDVKPMARRGA